jgi:type IV pilus assembly protein PilB
MPDSNLGEILLKSKVLNDEKLTQAQRYQTRTGATLAESIVKLGFASEEAVTMAISQEIAVPYASVENKILIPEKGQGLEKLIGEKFARNNYLIPLFIEDDSLAVAMADPTNVIILDNLKVMTNMEIQPFIGTKSQILKVIDAFYQSKDLIEEAMTIATKPSSKDDVVDVDTDVEQKLDLDKIIVREGKGAQPIRIVNAILKQAISERASDIHLELFDERVSLRFRVDGILYERTPPPKDMVSMLISRIKILSKLDISERRLPQDGNFAIRFQNRVIEIRVSVCPTVFGEKLVLRILDKGQVELNIDKLGFETYQKTDFLRASRFPHGLIFLTGPTGSGKTTTLNAVLSTIKTPEKNFMTLEDPVEFKIEGISQVQIKPQIGLSFATGLRSFLRQDPDVILVGEVRDQETAEACLRAALTGHLVLSTLHTNDALGAIPRLIDMGMEPFLLSSSLALVASQRLVRVLCPHCKVAYKPEKRILDKCLKEGMFPSSFDASTLNFYRPKGCDKCNKTGYRGRKAIYEVYFINEEMRNIIYRSQDLIQLRNSARKSGVLNLRASAWRKVAQGVTAVSEVFAVTLEGG